MDDGIESNDAMNIIEPSALRIQCEIELTRKTSTAILIVIPIFMFLPVLIHEWAVLVAPFGIILERLLARRIYAWRIGKFLRRVMFDDELRQARLEFMESSPQRLPIIIPYAMLSYYWVIDRIYLEKPMKVLELNASGCLAFTLSRAYWGEETLLELIGMLECRGVHRVMRPAVRARQSWTDLLRLLP